MLNKEKIKKNFKKSITTYNQNALAQRIMAQKLAQFIKIEGGFYKNILEIGSYSGFLTEELTKCLEFERYCALDIIDSFDFIQNLNPKIEFQAGDVEKVEFKEKFDLIASSSSLQWCEDIIGVVKKLKSCLNKRGVLALGLFAKDNLKEIRNSFGIGLEYCSIDEIRTHLKGAQIVEDEIVLDFKTAKDALKHLKLTGVNSLEVELSLSSIKKGLETLSEKYNNRLTYKPIYIIFSNISKIESR